MLELFEELEKFNNIVYYDEPHVYYIDGKKATSGTAVTKCVKQPFDSDKISKIVAKKQGKTQKEVLTDWDTIREAGTELHAYLENRLNNKVFPYPKQRIVSMFEGSDPVEPRFQKLIKIADKFVADARDRLIPIKSELVLGDKEYGICGMIDQVFYNKKSGQLELWDWKTNSKFDTKSSYKLKAPLAHLDSSKLSEYSLQLGLYKHIVEKNTSLRFGTSRLVWFDAENEKYHVYDALDIEDEIVTMIKHFLKNR